MVRGPINCSHYIVCDEDEPYHEFCPDGLLFNPDIQDCDDPDYVDCGNEYYDSGEYEDYDDYSEEEEEEEDEEESTENEVDDRDNDDPGSPCPPNDNPTKVVFVASKTSCSEFFLCYHGVAISMHCTDSLHFNSITKKCDFPRNANCRVDGDVIPNAPPKCDRNVFMEVYPHPTKCDYYYFCRKGYLSIQQCPFYYYFDAAMRTCRYSNGYQC